jgi:hypothetical protein
MRTLNALSAEILCGKHPQIVNDYIKTGKVKYFFRDMPMQSHPHAITAARGARCAGEQGKFWDMHKRLFANQAALAVKDLVNQAKQLELDTNLANVYHRRNILRIFKRVRPKHKKWVSTVLQLSCSVWPTPTSRLLK